MTKHWNMPIMSQPGGPPVIWEPIADRDVSSLATVDINWAGDYDAVVIHFANAKPVTDGVQPRMRLSGDGGSTFDSGASDYFNRSHFWHTTQTTEGNAQAFIPLSRLSVPQGNQPNEWSRGRIIIARPADPATKTQLIGFGGYDGTVPDIHNWQCFAQRDTAKRIDGWRFYYASGNVSEGRFIAYGLRAQ